MMRLFLKNVIYVGDDKGLWKLIKKFFVKGRHTLWEGIRNRNKASHLTL